MKICILANEVMLRIIAKEGQMFKQIRRKEFTYELLGNAFKLSTI